MWLPDWLYERLPLLYLAAGAACLWFLGSAVAMSAFLLGAAALITYNQRCNARRDAAFRRPVTAKRADGKGRLAAESSPGSRARR